MRTLLLLTAWLGCIFTVHAQLLWKISGNGLEKPSYIFGTHHIAPVSICDSIQGFKEAFEETGQLYGELIMQDSFTPDFMEQMNEIATLPADSSLKTLYTPEEYRLLDEKLKSYFNIGAEQFDRVKPNAINTQIAVTFALKAFPDFNQQEQLDGLLQKTAARMEKPVFGFETAIYQLRLMYDYPLAEQAKDLMESLRYSDEEMMKLTQEMADAYLNQDLEELYRVMTTDKTHDDAFMKRIVDCRNHNWVKQMPAIMAGKPTFFVVGAGHLPGKEGVLRLLEEKGYRIEAVK